MNNYWLVRSTYLLKKISLLITGVLFLVPICYTQNDILLPPPPTDIEVSIATPKSTVGVWAYIPITVTISNTSLVEASNIILGLNVCINETLPFGITNDVGLVYTNRAITASKGSYSKSVDQWAIAHLAGGESATLTLTLFTLQEKPIHLLANLVYVDQTDEDSTPVEFSNCMPVEDDEALLIINPVDQPTACSGDVVLTTQAEVDTYFGNCDNLFLGYDGSIRIEGQDITNLKALEDLAQRIEGDLTIVNTSISNAREFASLSSMKGSLNLVDNQLLEQVNFGGLLSIGGSITIQGNPKIKSLSIPVGEGVDDININGNSMLTTIDFPFLSTMKGDLSITFNNQLKSLTGFLFLNITGGSLIIGGNPHLTSIAGFKNVREVNGNLVIAENAITALDGLQKLESIGGNFTVNRDSNLEGISLPNLLSISGDVTISELPALKDLDGLAQLNTIEGQLIIVDNSHLVSVEGLSNLNTLNILNNDGGLVVRDNPKLSDCCVLDPILNLSTVLGKSDIRNNASYCNSEEEVAEKCDILPPGKTDLELSISADNLNPKRYTRFSVKLTVKNNSTIPTTDIRINSFTICDGDDIISRIIVPSGGSSIVSKGRYDANIWSIDQLDPGESATLSIKFFVLKEQAFALTAAIYTATPIEDIDSTPNIATPIGQINNCQATEDDEVRLAFHQPIISTCELLNSIEITPCSENGPDVTVYEYMGQNYLIETSKDGAPTLVKDCDSGQIVCVSGRTSDPADCQNYTAQGTKIETIQTCETTTDFIDIELALTTSIPNPKQYSKFPVVATISNKGTAVVKDVFVRFSVCGFITTGFISEQGIVYSSASITPSQGSYAAVSQVWNVGELAANSTATLELPLFALTDEPRRILGAVIGHSGTDIDSNPNNGFNMDCTISEDDESIVNINNGPAPCPCPAFIDPVCGSDGITYNNSCEAECLGLTWTAGACTEEGITCGEMTITKGDGSITIIGKTTENYFFKIHRRQPKWEYVYECSSNCGSEQTINDLISGTYYVDVYNKSWKLLCDDIEVVVGNSLQTEEAVERNKQPAHRVLSIAQEVQVYPNPASSFITIGIPKQLQGKGQILLSDHVGRLVQTYTFDKMMDTPLDVSSLNNGLYYLTIVVEEQIVKQEKVVVLK